MENDKIILREDKNDTITRREFTKQLAAGVGSVALLKHLPTGAVSNTQSDNKRPNILFISSDQHSYNFIGYAGHSFVQTPNLDRIARAGVTFSNTYVGSPICTPGRACMMTGMFPSDCNSFGNYTIWDGSHPTWGTRLQESGYYAWATGKIELNPEYPIGFENGNYHNGHYHNGDIMELFRRPVGYRVNERPGINGTARKDRYSHDVNVLKNAQHFIHEKAPRIDKPWAAYIGYTEPHPPNNTPEKYFHYYYLDKVDMPNVPPELVENMDLVYQQLRRFKRIAMPISDERIRKARAGYCGKISELDEYVEKLWEALEASGQLEQTIVIYTSDHGDAMGRYGLWRKNNLYEGAQCLYL